MSNENQSFRVIRPDSRTEEGVITAVLHLVNEIWLFRSHIWIVFKEQFRGAYHGSSLGVFWNYALPIVPLTVYLFLSRLRVFPDFEGVNAAVFLTFGVALWFFFSGCIQTPIQVVQSRNSEVMKTSFPLSAAIISGFAKLLFDTLIRMIFVLGVVILTKSWPSLLSLFFPVILFPAVLLFIGAGFFLGILNVIYSDVSRVVSILLQYGIFVSGVLFPLQHTGLLASLNLFNPLAVFIEATRSFVFHGAVTHLNAYCAMTAFSVVFFMLSCRLFFIMEYRVRGIS